MWYDTPIQNTEPVECPVCKSILGNRDPKSIFKGHCEECKASFIWHPNKKKPAAILDADERHHRCGCGCGR